MIQEINHNDSCSSRIDFIAYAAGQECKNSYRQTNDKLLALSVIDCSVSDYLYFGLDEEGQHVPDNFWSAVEFFFRIRSWDPSTWMNPPIIEHTIEDSGTGKRIKHTIIPTQETLKLQCFDNYFEVAELSKLIDIETFLSNLEKRRVNILLRNKNQIRKTIESIRRRFLFRSGQLGFLHTQLENFPDAFMDVLVHPTEPEQLEDLLYPDKIAPIKRRYHTRFGIRHGLPRVFSMLLKPLCNRTKGQRVFNLCEQQNS